MASKRINIFFMWIAPLFSTFYIKHALIAFACLKRGLIYQQARSILGVSKGVS